MLDYARDPAAIYRGSFAAIAAEADLSGLPADMVPVATRMIHACGMPDIVADLRFSDDAAARGIAALAAGAPLICDVRMVAAGIMAERLGAVLVAIDADGSGSKPADGQTRSAAGIERLRDRIGGAVVAIGNAPTALFRLLELVEAGAPKPALVIGIPVGFVGAAESKAALAANRLGLPFITVLGRRGGSAIAAAVANALILAARGAPAPAAKAKATDAASFLSPPGRGKSEHSSGLGEGAVRGARDRPLTGSTGGESASPDGVEEHQASPWLSIVGIGENGFDGLSPAARALVDGAEFLIGARRHFSRLPAAPNGQERILWTSPLAETTERVLAMRGRRVTVLATGDPMHYGIGATIAGRVAPDEVAVVPHISSFALAAARLLWPLDRTTLLSVHGRPIERIAPHVTPGARLLILAHDGRTPQQIAAMLAARGFGESRMVALAHMGGDLESRTAASARAWSAEVPDLHVLAVECVAAPGARWWPRTAGLPDDAFVHDGKLTKREARALALAKLMPHPGAILWDVGAGCGSVAVEWLRAEPGNRAIALEPLAERRAMAAQNAAALGVPGLDIRDATAPEGLMDLPEPDAVFIGGGISAATIAASAAALKPGGRLVAHAVTLESEAVLLAVFAERGGELVRLSVARAEPIGAFSGWRPAMPVTQWAWTKA